MTKILKQLGVPLLPLMFAVGAAWATAAWKLDGKVDKSTYQAQQDRRAALDSTIVRELRVIKYLQCRPNPDDSYCHQ